MLCSRNWHPTGIGLPLFLKWNRINCRIRSRMSMLCSQTFSQKSGLGVQRKATTYSLRWMAETEDRACQARIEAFKPTPGSEEPGVGITQNEERP